MEKWIRLLYFSFVQALSFKSSQLIYSQNCKYVRLMFCSKPSQGRLPVRVKLSEITEEDMYRILVEPEANIILQQRALLRTEGVDLRFTEETLREIARISIELNRTVENIGMSVTHLNSSANSSRPLLLIFLGARRLYTVVEKVVEDISYNAMDYVGQVVVIDKEQVQEIYNKAFAERADLKHYII